LYAFPKNFSTHQELKDSTLDQLEEFRLSKIPKIKTSIIVDGFKQSYEEIYKTIESLMPILNNDNQNIVSTDLCVLLCSEQKDKLKFVEYLENNIKAGHDPIKTQRVIDETVNVSIIEQRPYVFLHNDSLDLVGQFDCFSCNLINFNTLKRHNTSDTDTQADKNLMYVFMAFACQNNNFYSSVYFLKRGNLFLYYCCFFIYATYRLALLGFSSFN